MTTMLLISIVAAAAGFALVAVATLVVAHRSGRLHSAHLMHAAQPPAEQRRRPRFGRRRDYSALL